MFLWEVGYEDFADMDGWYIADRVICPSASYKVAPRAIAHRTNKATIFAWSPPVGHQYIAFPKQWCIPCRRSDYVSCLTVEPTVEWASKYIDTLVAASSETRLKATPKALPGSANPPAGVPQTQGEQLRGPYVTTHCLGPGWFERCSALVRLVKKGHPDGEALAMELYTDSKHLTKKVAASPPVLSDVKPWVF